MVRIVTPSVNNGKRDYFAERIRRCGFASF